MVNIFYYFTKTLVNCCYGDIQWKYYTNILGYVMTLQITTNSTVSKQKCMVILKACESELS